MRLLNQGVAAVRRYKLVCRVLSSEKNMILTLIYYMTAWYRRHCQGEPMSRCDHIECRSQWDRHGDPN